MGPCGCVQCTCGLQPETEGNYIPSENQNLIQIGEFPLHSGGVSKLKFELDKFTESDWEAIAYLASRAFKFQYVVGIPTGGMRLAQAMAKYATGNEEDPIALVDDVWTTGGSMKAAYDEIYETLPLHKQFMAVTGILGIVAIARTVPDVKWMRPFLTMGKDWDA